jgi:hypothetical protein
VQSGIYLANILRGDAQTAIGHSQVISIPQVNLVSNSQLLRIAIEEVYILYPD